MQMADQEPPAGGNALKRKISRIDDSNDSHYGNYCDNSDIESAQRAQGI